MGSAGEGAAEMRHSTRQIALCGILAALATALLFLGGLFPFATYTAPALAGIVLWPIGLEYNLRTGLLAWVVVSFLGLLLVPDLEMSLIFVFLLGYYPMVKQMLDRIQRRPLRWLAKLALFNLAVFAMYGLLLFVFPISGIVEEFAEYAGWFLLVLLLAANLAFILYDLCLVRVRLIYHYRLRPLLFGKGR